jgi:hypothetical protein
MAVTLDTPTSFNSSKHSACRFLLQDKHRASPFYGTESRGEFHNAGEMSSANSACYDASVM